MSYYRSSASLRRRSSASIPSVLIVMLLIGAVIWTVESWWAMLMLGIAHGFDARVPAFGFWTVAFLSSAVAAMAGTAMYSSRRNRNAS